MHREGRISIWLFIGAVLLVYGILITASGLYYLANPPERATVMAEVHAPIWWGALLIVLGAVYTWKFWPRPR